MDVKKPIGVYDSGSGGLSVLSKLVEQFPFEDFVYVADTKNLPYGNKTKSQIQGYSQDVVSFLQNTYGVKLVVAACHTSSALALDTVMSSVPVIGMIKPFIQAVMPYKRLGILATQASADSQMHEKLLKENGFEGDVCTVGCPQFVPLIESDGPIDKEALKTYANSYLESLRHFKADAVVYGCTHYTFIWSIIESLFPCIYIDPAPFIVKEVAKLMTQNNLLSLSKTPGKVRFHVTGAMPKLLQTKQAS